MRDPIRECGSCTACCTVIGVPEIQKDAGEPCRHLCEAGCEIYARRPESCRRFACQWLLGTLEFDGTVDTALRPDSCGLILDYQPDTPFGEVYRAWELEPGAAARGHARTIIEELEGSFLVILMSRDPASTEGQGACRFVGPPHRVAQASDVMWSRPGG